MNITLNKQTLNITKSTITIDVMANNITIGTHRYSKIHKQHSFTHADGITMEDDTLTDVFAQTKKLVEEL